MDRPQIQCGRWELVSVIAAHLRLGDVFPVETVRGVIIPEVQVLGLEFVADQLVLIAR